MRLWVDGTIPPLENQLLYDFAADYVPAASVGQFRADVARYELLWRFGGVYVDVDFEALGPIDPLLGPDVACFAAWEQQGVWVNNAVIGAEQGHLFLKRLIDGLPASAERRKGQTPNRISGPQHLTRIYRGNPSGVTVFDQRLFYPYLHSDLGTAKAEPPWPDTAVAVHHWANKRRQRTQSR